jgi:2',3'-cyclic-nucleotide 2'-phosphodiesterase
MNILFVADVFGAPGRRAVEQRLPELRHELEAGFCVVNAENAADGAGLTAKLATRLLERGADVLTTGNHVWRHHDLVPLLEASDRLLRPANLGGVGAPGRGLTVRPSANGASVAVINLEGALFMETQIHPFLVAEDLVAEALGQTPIVVVDFHAEATSEKVALARLLDGRATAVVGTHTHVQTADARVLSGGTAAITDAGMTGPHDSVIGVRADLAIRRMQVGLPVRFHPADRDVRIEGVLVECDASGRATRCDPVRVAVE